MRQAGLEHLAKNTTSSEKLLQLAQKNDYHVRRNVAENINTPKEALLQLAEDSSPDVRKAVAKNSSSDLKIIKKVLFYKHPPKVLINRNIKSPVKINVDEQEYLIEAPIYVDDPEALAAAASNPKLNFEFVEQLIENLNQILQWEWGDEFVVGIVLNPNIPVSILEWFAGEEYFKIHHDAFFKSTLDRYAYMNISRNDPRAEEKYKKSIDTLSKQPNLYSGLRSSSDKYASGIIGKIYWSMIQNSAISLELKNNLLLRITNDKALIKNIDYELAKSSKVPPNILDKLVTLGGDMARRKLAENPKVNAGTLRKLLHDKDNRVKEIAKKNLKNAQEKP